MALKDLSSLYDLVGGNQPVGNMSNQQGAQSFDLGPNSTLQQNSLPEIPVESPFQDLNGQPGPQFDLGEDSMLQENSLPNIPVDSPYQDLDGVDGGNGYFHDIPNPGKYQGKQLGGVDLHEHLLNNSYQYSHGDSPENVGPAPGHTGNSEYQDLDGIDGGNGYFHDIANPGKYQGKKIGIGKKAKDLHEHLLTNPYNYTYGNSSQFYNNTENVGPSPGQTGNSEYQDLDGIDGGNGFFHGVDQRTTLQGKKIFKNDDLHISLLKNQNYGYSYGITTLGNQPGQAGPYLDPSIDLNGGLPSTGKYEDNMPS